MIVFWNRVVFGCCYYLVMLRAAMLWVYCVSFGLPPEWTPRQLARDWAIRMITGGDIADLLGERK